MKTVHVPTLQVDDELSKPHQKQPDSGYPCFGVYQPLDDKSLIDALYRSTDNLMKSIRIILDDIKERNEK